jgi:membrane protein YdbS with pleckstrin-like domain
MPEKDPSTASNTIPSTAKIEGVIITLTVLITIGKCLPWIVLAFATVNLILAVLCFTWWSNVLGGIINLVLAIAGFFFFSQLVKRRKIHRYNYGYRRRDLPRDTKSTDEGKVRAEAR